MWKFYIDGQQVQEPIGWDSTGFFAKRLESKGMDQPFIAELTWTGKDALLLKSYFDSEFINAVVPFQILSTQKVNGSEYVFSGYINFFEYKEEKTCSQPGWKVTVGVYEEEFKSKFLSRQKVEVDLINETSLDGDDIGPAPLEIFRNHSQELYLQAIGGSLDTLTQFLLSTSTDPAELSIVVPTYFQNSDFQGPFSGTFDVSGSRRSDFNVIFKNNGEETRNITITGKGSINLTPDGVVGTGSDVTFQIFARVFEIGNYATGTLYADLDISQPCPILADSTFDYEFEVTVPVPVNYGIVVQLGYKSAGGWSLVETDAVFGNNQSLILAEYNMGKATVSQGFYLFDLMDRTLAKIVGYSGALISDTFAVGTGKYWNFEVTTGLLLRNGLPDTMPFSQIIRPITNKFNTTWEEVFNALDAIFCLGWQFEFDAYGSLRIRVESRDYFYQQTLIGDFQKVSDFELMAMSDMVVNGFKIGYTDKWKNRGISGVFELCTERNYFVPNRARKEDSTNALQIQSSFIAAGYAIRFYQDLQIQRDQSGTTDQPNDNDKFILWLNYETVAFDEISGTGYDFPNETGAASFLPGTVTYGSNFLAEVESPIENVYNVLITPARNAARHWKWIGAHTFGLDTNKAKLFFQSGDYYTDFESRITTDSAPIEALELDGSALFSEQSDIYPAIMNDFAQEYILKPIRVDFTAPQSLCDFLSMVTPGNGYVRVTSGKQVFFGYIQDATNKPTDPRSGKSTISLILAAQTPSNGDYNNDYNEDFNIGN